MLDRATEPIKGKFYRYIKTRYADIRVLMFSMSSENVYAKRFLKAGAMGFISKNSGLSELKKAVELVTIQRKSIAQVGPALQVKPDGIERQAHFCKLTG